MAFEMNEMQKVLFDKLKPLQREVALNSLSGMSDIDSYRNSNGKAKTESAQRASVCEILANHNVVTFLDSMKVVAVNDAIMSRERMMEILSRVADMSTSELNENSLGLLTELKGGFEVKMKAMKQLADLAGYDAPTKTELSGVGGGPIEVKEIQDDELKEKLRSIGLGRYHNQLGSKVVD